MRTRPVLRSIKVYSTCTLHIGQLYMYIDVSDTRRAALIQSARNILSPGLSEMPFDKARGCHAEMHQAIPAKPLTRPPDDRSLRLNKRQQLLSSCLKIAERMVVGAQHPGLVGARHPVSHPTRARTAGHCVSADGTRVTHVFHVLLSHTVIRGSSRGLRRCAYRKVPPCIRFAVLRSSRTTGSVTLDLRTVNFALHLLAGRLLYGETSDPARAAVRHPCGPPPPVASTAVR
jgi:hypothetical protein